jgi:hypothetical protein
MKIVYLLFLLILFLPTVMAVTSDECIELAEQCADECTQECETEKYEYCRTFEYSGCALDVFCSCNSCSNVYNYRWCEFSGYLGCAESAGNTYTSCIDNCNLKMIAGDDVSTCWNDCNDEFFFQLGNPCKDGPCQQFCKEHGYSNGVWAKYTQEYGWDSCYCTDEIEEKKEETIDTEVIEDEIVEDEVYDVTLEENEDYIDIWDENAKKWYDWDVVPQQELEEEFKEEIEKKFEEFEKKLEKNEKEQVKRIKDNCTRNLQPTLSQDDFIKYLELIEKKNPDKTRKQIIAQLHAKIYSYDVDRTVALGLVKLFQQGKETEGYEKVDVLFMHVPRFVIDNKGRRIDIAHSYAGIRSDLNRKGTTSKITLGLSRWIVRRMNTHTGDTFQVIVHRDSNRAPPNQRRGNDAGIAIAKYYLKNGNDEKKLSEAYKDYFETINK